MGLRELLGLVPKAASSPEPPYRDDACPSCGGTHFKPGEPVVRARSNGVSAQARPEGAMLQCLGCGAPWFTTAHGLVEPDESALPPAWLAVMDRVRAREGAKDAPGSRNGPRDDSRPKRRVPGPNEGFMMPPKV